MIPTADQAASTAKPATAADNLRAARALIEDEDHWTQDAYCRDAAGQELSPSEIDIAVCFCSLGALAKAGAITIGGVTENIADEVRLLERAMGSDVPKFNDNYRRTHAEVLAAFDKAIELAEAAQ